MDYDVIVIGAGPAGCQAAISAAHQMRHVLLLNAGLIRSRKGRAFWSKSVEIEDVPVFPGVTGPALRKELDGWIDAHPITEFTIAGEKRKSGIVHQAGVVLKVTRKDDGTFELETSTAALKQGVEPTIEHFAGKALVIAAGFEDVWPDIETNSEAESTFKQHQMVFRYAGNKRGWHVCVRCDGHLHVDEHLCVLAVGDEAYEITIGAQDFTDKITIMTNGRPHGLSDEILEKVKARNIDIVEEKIVRHIGQKTELLALELEDGRELAFSGFLVDEGLTPNTAFLDGWDYQKDDEGLIVVDDDRQMLDGTGEKIPGLFAAGDLLSGERNLIATSFALGQDAGLAASDSLRTWD
jgi:thioredoxin reductase (NADPH)